MTDSKKPTHRAFIVKKFNDKEGTEKSRWLDIGSVWTHRDGKGFDVNLEAVPLDGRIVIRLDEPKSSRQRNAYRPRRIVRRGLHFIT